VAEIEARHATLQRIEAGRSTQSCLPRQSGAPSTPAELEIATADQRQACFACWLAQQKVAKVKNAVDLMYVLDDWDKIAFMDRVRSVMRNKQIEGGSAPAAVAVLDPGPGRVPGMCSPSPCLQSKWGATDWQVQKALYAQTYGAAAAVPSEKQCSEASQS
jgi:hypothetical protein